MKLPTIVRAALLASLLALALIPAVAGASSSTQAIIDDVAADGQVNGTYSAAQLQAALASPLLAQYGGTGGVQGVQTALSGSNAGTTTPATTAGTGSSGNLPFTGADALLFVAVGGGLLAAGLVLRRMGRSSDGA